MGEPTEISDAELERLWRSRVQGRHASESAEITAETLERLVAALRATRARLAAAEAVCEVVGHAHWVGPQRSGKTAVAEAFYAWRALAHPEPEEAPHG